MVKLLIVDDSKMARKMIVQTLHQGGVFNDENTRFLEAGDGIQGLQEFGIRKPHLVLTDSIMPEMDGFQMIAEIRKINPKIPIIMILAEDTPDVIQRAMAKGMATDYVIKPVEPGVLEKKLLKAFQELQTGQG